MKKILLLIVAVMLSPAILKAAPPVSIYPGMPESNYGITMSTVLVSVGVTTDTAVSGYRQICATNLAPSTTVYFKVDSTATIALQGYPIMPRTEKCIEYNGYIYWSLATGASAIDLPRIIIRK